MHCDLHSHALFIIASAALHLQRGVKQLFLGKQEQPSRGVDRCSALMPSAGRRCMWSEVRASGAIWTRSQTPHPQAPSRIASPCLQPAAETGARERQPGFLSQAFGERSPSPGARLGTLGGGGDMQSLAGPSTARSLRCGLPGGGSPGGRGEQGDAGGAPPNARSP